MLVTEIEKPDVKKAPRGRLTGNGLFNQKRCASSLDSFNFAIEEDLLTINPVSLRSRRRQSVSRTRVLE